MSRNIIGSLSAHRRVLLLGVAITVVALYMLPIDQLGVVFGKSDSGGKNKDPKDEKTKDNNCENGLPPHKNGNSDNGNHYGCLKHL